ncbi:hypothetical protein XENORESO_009448 [Xenotaenia resolanae]|uniref:Uncharacterized protein n=1 Tax=Xenotaenia resolanae TaxID=208358 RepID=A0ABV0WM52_9TELE
MCGGEGALVRWDQNATFLPICKMLYEIESTVVAVTSVKDPFFFQQRGISWLDLMEDWLQFMKLGCKFTFQQVNAPWHIARVKKAQSMSRPKSNRKLVALKTDVHKRSSFTDRA